jgi:hypothetical protein
MSLASWAHVRDPATEDAKRRLAELPESETDHGKRVPWPVADKSAIKSHFSNTEINTAIRKAPKKTVSLEGLHAIQHSVKAKHVADYIDHPNLMPEDAQHNAAKVPVDVPTIIRYAGKSFLWDGHHRSVAQWLLGAKSIEARVVDLPAASPP